MMSQWARWRHKSPASRLFTQPFIRAQIKVNIRAPRHWPLCGEFTGDRWIPRTNGQLRGKCFHSMTSSWDPLLINTSVNEDINVEFTSEEIKWIAKKFLKNGKTCGIDHVRNNFLKAACDKCWICLQVLILQLSIKNRYSSRNMVYWDDPTTV